MVNEECLGLLNNVRVFQNEQSDMCYWGEQWTCS